VKRLLIISIFLLVGSCGFGQDYNYDKSIEKTDSSIITTFSDEWQGIKRIQIYNDLKKKPITYYSELYPKTRIVKLKGKSYNDYDNRIGLWQHYNKDGKLIRTDDYNTGRAVSYISNDTLTDKFNAMLSKADSFIIYHFGEKFFNNNTKFNANTSDWNTGSYDWFERRGVKDPYNFMFDYDIVIGKNQYSSIYFYIDSTGIVDVTGFTDCLTQRECDLKINYKDALLLAKENGLALKKGKFFTDLVWHKPKLDSINGKPNFHKVYKGKYEYMIASYRTKRKVGNQSFKETVAVYDAIYINPWTGEFIRKDEVKKVIRWSHPKEGHGGHMGIRDF
jgi:hypothetical protein